ncbi:MAG: glycine cleavage system protein H [Acidobacteria bacterium]|nr:glycine cleavage system protein H [Acidobacteriota bacterium]
MEGVRFIDIYATKGIEYLIVISFLAAFVLFCRYIDQPSQERAVPRAAPEHVTRFRVPAGLFYHQGHGWLRPEPSSIGVVGLDDFAQKLVGKVDAIELPAVGSRLAQGEMGWSLMVDSVHIPMLSPVAGEVVEVNREVLQCPEIVHQDPYGKGWLLKVKPSSVASNTRNLLSGKLARIWMEDALDKLCPLDGGSLGPLLQDGGLPLSGMARIIDPEHWDTLARTHLLTDDKQDACSGFSRAASRPTARRSRTRP